MEKVKRLWAAWVLYRAHYCLHHCAVKGYSHDSVDGDEWTCRTCVSDADYKEYARVQRALAIWGKR